MDNHHMDSFDGSCCWSDLIDYSGLLDDVAPVAELYWNPLPPSQNIGEAVDVSHSGTTAQVSEIGERECPRRGCLYGKCYNVWVLGGRSDPCGGIGTKACRERMRREKLNDKFSELSAVLEPGRPVKTDKLAILSDAIRILNQLKTESQEYTEMNERLLEEIKNLKAEKNELRQEKLMLKADEERMEQQLKIINVPPTGFMPAHPPVYQAEVNKVPMFPSYGFVPMWQYLPPSARDTSQDHELRPPAA
ncbi:Transcription factor [Sesamum angolense]|uniref:Transcription factor n=1 Tax=Sesamum angolense TaxID=2727404 RepID=A0AAE1X6R4_9LAMI|nr:Transcription factor [Sesamum angolense]